MCWETQWMKLGPLVLLKQDPFMPKHQLLMNNQVAQSFLKLELKSLICFALLSKVEKRACLAGQAWARPL